MSFMLLNLILPFLCRKIQARIKNCQSSKNFAISVFYAISVIGPESHAISVSGARYWSTIEEFAISEYYAISVMTPDSHAISVAGAKQKLDLKKYAISMMYAISVNAPEDYAISVPRVKKQGKDQRVTLLLARK
jgi:hypothetical protein